MSRRLRRTLLGLISMLACLAAEAQLGPVDTGGYAEYRLDHIAGRNTDSPVSQRLAVRTDFATYIWRPWLATANGGLNIVYGSSDNGITSRKTTSLGGNVRLNLLPRSRFPLAIYFSDSDEDSEAAAVQTSGATRQYGFTQQFHTRRFGRYNLDWQRGRSSSESETSISVRRLREFERAELSIDKSLGAHRFGFTSRYLDLDSDAPDSTTESLRHTLRHNFRRGTNLTWRNDAFVSDENQTNEVFWSDRRFYQFNSMMTFIPETRRRLLITGRGLFQGSDSLTPMTEFAQENASISASANYYLTDRFSLAGGIGAARRLNDDDDSSGSHFQQLSSNYRSAKTPLWGGAYTYRASLVVANRSDDSLVDQADQTDMAERQTAGTTLGHGFSKRFNVGRSGQLHLQLSQDASTNIDSVGRERNQLRHSVHITSGAQGDAIERFIRLSLTDQQTFGDERRTNQLVNLQLSFRGRPDSDRHWTGNVSMQYGVNRLQKPVKLAGESESLGYSVNLDYRHANLWGVSNLDFNSEFRFLSSDLQTDDPLDLDIGFDNETHLSYWRNRLRYTIGLLRLNGIVTVREVDGGLVAGITLTVRRYFGH